MWAWLSVLRFSGEGTRWDKVVTAGALRAGTAAPAPGAQAGGDGQSWAGTGRPAPLSTTRPKVAGEARRKMRPSRGHPVLALSFPYPHISNHRWERGWQQQESLEGQVQLCAHTEAYIHLMCEMKEKRHQQQGGLSCLCPPPLSMSPSLGSVCLLPDAHYLSLAQLPCSLKTFTAFSQT